ncbi:MFS transporter [Euryarchaeota archaeon ex4484_178]|nr:MAG: MFS transporter [Euryarchaeota archaeon ex4484_178]
MKRVLSNRNFLKLWIGQVVSNIGDEVAFMGLAALLVFKWEGSATDVSLFFIFASLPVLIFGPIAGVFVDRWKRKSTMIWADILRAGIAFGFIFSTELWHLMVLIFLLSSISRFFYPARNAMIPNIVKEEKLVEANSLSQMSYMLAVIVGPGLGAGLVALLGYTTTFIFDAASYLFSAFMILLIRYREKIERSERKAWGEMLEGFRYMAKNKAIRLIVTIFGLIMLVIGGLNVIYTLYIRDVLHMDVVGLGILETLFGIGAILGSVLVGLLAGKIKNMHLISMGIIFIGLLIFIMAIVPFFLVVIIVVMGIGAMNSLVSSPTNAILQKAVKDEYRGKIFGAQGAIIQGAALISMGMMGILIDVFGIINILIFSGIYVILIGAYLILNKKAEKLMEIVD